MHVLVVGGMGQLGRAFLSVFGALPGVRTSSWDLPEDDITDPAISDRIAGLHPDLVLNAAAWTNVDGAESNPDGAYASNALGPRHLAEGCKRCGASLVQISTNEVFPGMPGQFYREYDMPAPSSVYARSKAAGERAVQMTLDQHYVVRIAWLFGQWGNHFPIKIVAAADKYGALRVVDDEIGNPTYTFDVARSVARLVETGRYGIYHLVNEGSASRFEFAREVLVRTGRQAIPIEPISLDTWPRPAPPPKHAVLVNQAAAALGIRLPSWQDALDEYLSLEPERFRQVSY